MARLVKNSFTSISLPSFSPILTRKVKRERANSDPRPTTESEKDDITNNVTKDTLLVYAVKYGDVDIVEELLISGCDPNSTGISREYAIHEAVTQANVKMTELLIRHGADVNVRNELGQTPVQRSVLFDDVKSLKVLHQAGAVVDDTDLAGRTLLDIALQESNESVCLYLMQNGLDARAVNRHKENHLKTSQFSSRVVSTLSDFSKKIKEKREKGHSSSDKTEPKDIFRFSLSNQFKRSLLSKLTKKDKSNGRLTDHRLKQIEPEIPLFGLLEIR